MGSAYRPGRLAEPTDPRDTDDHVYSARSALAGPSSGRSALVPPVKPQHNPAESSETRKAHRERRSPHLHAGVTGAAIQAVSPQEGGLASGVSSTTRQIGAVLSVAVLGAIVHTREYGGASFESGLNSAFLAAGAATLACAVFTGLWLTAARTPTAYGPNSPEAEPSVSRR